MTTFRFDDRTINLVADELPVLNGSAKQVAWADDIRSGLIQTQVATRLCNLRSQASLKGVSSEEIAKNTSSVVARLNGKLAAFLDTKDSAKFWIENRNCDLETASR